MTDFASQPPTGRLAGSSEHGVAFEADLQALDRDLAAMAASHSAPVGLADRVYDASLAHLPARRHRYEVVVQSRRSLWSRLAMAACVALAFVVGRMVLQSNPANEPIVASNIAVEAMPVALDSEAEWVLLDAMSTPSGEPIAYLLETRDATMSDLAADLEQVFDDMEM